MAETQRRSFSFPVTGAQANPEFMKANALQHIAYYLEGLYLCFR